MGAPTAYARVEARLPRVAKPTLRLWADAIRLEALAELPDGRSKLRAAAQALFAKAIDGDTAALAIIGDRLDGKAKVDQDDDGKTTLSFVVRLPSQADPAEWAKTITNDAPWQPDEAGQRTEDVPQGNRPADGLVDAAGNSPVDSQPLQSGANLDAVKIEVVERDLASVKTDPPPLADPLPVVPGGRRG